MDLAQLLLREPVMWAIWLLLFVLAVPGLVVLASPEGVRRPRQALREAAEALRGYRDHRRQRRQQALDTVRYAQELAAAAEHAAATAQRWRDRWHHSRVRLDEAWQAWQDAEGRRDRSRAAAAFAAPETDLTPEGYAERERALARQVLAAARHGHLPIATVADALAGRDGWDPRLHPADQELHVHRAIAAHLAHRYRQAATAERLTWHDTQLAAATRDSLRAEAGAAATRAAGLRHLVPGAPTRQSAMARPGRQWAVRSELSA
ncbi:hypothetical protein Aph02nite_44820 [Actinoplanes philippinensis]|uniref:Uncharacterized protein n=1 Tax=Actinoplanes philippinensis TaxID=35752 RepID=A0A1I2I7L4_9ACTN|nr:hypothetical protein [Actinoplanes philippinensis]GIE78532.1 hypothetical protein Aph02nite_44820 [Actinoplanes philippinensis]SFF38224.1 hypothetical protein SAMN05421541_109394 [Actinoplanes philippinensis]